LKKRKNNIEKYDEKDKVKEDINNQENNGELKNTENFELKQA